MKPQIYDLDTRFNFGKHKGKTLLEVVNNYGGGLYLGYLISNNILWFILEPKTMDSLEKAGYFDDMSMPAYVSGGSIPLSCMGLKKDDIIGLFKKRYDDFLNDPTAYEELARQGLKEYTDRRRQEERNVKVNLENQSVSNDSEEDGPFEFGSPQDPNENPWLDVLPDDEADAAYWNTD